MKTKYAKKAAKEIGDDSWQLIHFHQLPNEATVNQQTYALRQDQHWLHDHIRQISCEIDGLIRDIEGGM